MTARPFGRLSSTRTARPLKFESLEQRALLTTFFIDGAGGDDANPGTAAQPFKTVQRGIDQADESVSPGADTVLIGRGTYTENLTIDDADPLVLRGRGATVAAADQNDDAIHILSGNVTVRDLTIAGPTGVVVDEEGEEETFDGLKIDNAESIRIVNVIVSGASDDGIDAADTLRVIVHGGKIKGNVGDGLKVSGADTIEVLGGTYEDNDDGLDLEDSGAARITGITAVNNGDEGMEVDGFDSVDVVGGYFAGNTEAGLDLDDTTTISVVGVIATGNGEHGLQVTAGDDDLEGSVIENVTITACAFVNNTGDGINIAAEPDGSVVRRVRLRAVLATGNSESGLDIAAVDVALQAVLSILNGEPDVLTTG